MTVKWIIKTFSFWWWSWPLIPFNSIIFHYPSLILILENLDIMHYKGKYHLVLDQLNHFENCTELSILGSSMSPLLTIFDSNITYNFMRGSIPPTFSNLTKLEVLYVLKNVIRYMIHMDIPYSLFQWNICFYWILYSIEYYRILLYSMG